MFNKEEEILVRKDNMSHWQSTKFLAKIDDDAHSFYAGMYLDVYGHYWREAIPLEGNGHLLGTSQAATIKEKLKRGDPVAVSKDGKTWFARVYRHTLLGAIATYNMNDSSGQHIDYWDIYEPFDEHFPSVKVDEY